MRGILSEVDLRLRELSPTARLMASGPNARGTRCISCDQQVQTAKDAIHVNANVYGITGTSLRPSPCFFAPLNGASATGEGATRAAGLSASYL